MYVVQNVQHTRIINTREPVPALREGATPNMNKRTCHAPVLQADYTLQLQRHAQTPPHPAAPTHAVTPLHGTLKNANAIQLLHVLQ